MNVVAIIIDTLRRDYLGAYGNDWIETPNIDNLAKESMVYDFSFVHSYPTIPHRTDVITGQYGEPFHPWMPLRHDRKTFVEELGKTGWCTQLIHDTPHLVNGGHNFDWPFHAWTPVRGAEVDRPWIDDSREWLSNWKQDPLFDFADIDVMENRTVLTYSRANRGREKHEDWNCARLFLTASQWLKDNSSRDNFFLWVDCFDPHEPWDAPPEFMQKHDQREGYDGTIDPRSFVLRNHEDLPEEARDHVAAQYAAKVSWVDHWVGQFLDTLDETGLSENTAVLFTADHGTNVGERGRFGKGYPVREQEARTPFMIRKPTGPTGQSSIIVQPQDIYATVMGMLDQPVPDALDSHNVLALEEAGSGGPRDVAIAGNRADGWDGDAEKILFTVFDRNWYLEVAAKPQFCRLTALGSLEEVSDQHPDLVEEMHRKAIDELEAHGAHPQIVEWLRSHGASEWPTDIAYWNGYPGPEGYSAYFGRLYTGE
ncbi:MAG: sulfatase [Candidatus Brocadiia bacterium]